MSFCSDYSDEEEIVDKDSDIRGELNKLSQRQL